MKFVECAYCGERINEGDACYTNPCGDAFCDEFCVQYFYCKELNFDKVWSEMNSDLDWHDDENNGE